MDLKQLEAFVSIATLRSFRGAANRLNLSQPAISLRLKTLEEELGTPLFDRQASRVQLTGKGLQLLGMAEEILDGAHKLKATAKDTPDAHQRIRMGATSTIANAWLCDLVEKILDEHKHLVIDLSIDTTRNLRTQLMGGEIDVAILMGSVHETGVHNVPLKSYGNEWIAGMDLPLPDRTLSIRDVAAYPIVTYAKDSATYGSLEETLRQSGVWPAAISTTNSVSTIVNLVARNKYVGIISDACLPRAGIRTLDCEMPLPRYQYVLSYHMDSIGRVGMAVADIAQTVC